MMLGHRLDSYRQDNGLSLRELADKIGVDEKTIRHAIAGGKLRLYTKSQIKKFLGINCDMSYEQGILESDKTIDVSIQHALNTLADEKRINAVSIAFSELAGSFAHRNDGFDRYAPVLDDLDKIIQTSTLSEHTIEVTQHMILLADCIDALVSSNDYDISSCKEASERLRGLEYIVSNEKRLEAVQLSFAFLRDNWKNLDPYPTKCACLNCVAIVLTHADDGEFARKRFFAAIYKSYQENCKAGYVPAHMLFNK